MICTSRRCNAFQQLLQVHLPNLKDNKFSDILHSTFHLNNRSRINEEIVNEKMWFAKSPRARKFCSHKQEQCVWISLKMMFNINKECDKNTIAFDLAK